MTAPEPATRPHGTGLWLLYLVWFYPCWWLAQVVVVAGPELVRSGSLGRFEQAAWALGGAAALCFAWLAIAKLIPALRPAACFGLVWTAYAVLGRGVTSASMRPESWFVAAALAAAGFGGLVFALGHLPLPSSGNSPVRRGLALATAVLGPLALALLAVAPVLGELRTSPPLSATLAAVATAVLLASRRMPPPYPRGPLVWQIALGMLATVGSFLGAREAELALRSRAEEARQPSMAPIPEAPSLPPVEPDYYYKGVNFTSEWPEPYGSKSAALVLAALPSYGVNSVALVPYASQRPGDLEIQFPLRMERDELVVATAKMARAEGLRVLLKPQIWVRGRELYPGDLRYDDPAERARWFASYTRFIEHYAKLATRIEADMFCVGVELAQLTPYQEEWRRIIAVAREHYRGQLVYAANFGPEFESVQFWDALDFIGLDNYYPLPDDRSVGEIATRIEAVHHNFQKPILFTEAGFSTYELSHREPWSDRPGGGLSPESQARNVEALLSGFHGRDWLRGIFWWKVGTSQSGGPDDGSHLLWNKPAMVVIAKWFNRPWR